MPITDLEALERATRAYFRAGPVPQPSNVGDVDCVRWHRGQRYVVFSNCNGLLAAFTIGEKTVRRVPLAKVPPEVQ